MWKENYRWHFDYARLAWDSGFSFATQKSHDILDKSNIAIIDVDRISQAKDVETVERFIPYIIQFKLDPELTQVLDSNFTKVFKISQLAVEYLNFCKMYLDNTVVLLKKELGQANTENGDLKACCDDLRNQIIHLRNKTKDSESVTTFKCEQCSKNFSTEEFLLAHLKRRHENQTFQQETDKLQMEIKGLKERLNCTEKFSNGDAKKEKPAIIAEDNSKIGELQQKFEILKVSVENELKLLQTQHTFQEKYERWFENAFNNLKVQGSDAAFVRPKETEENRDAKHPEKDQQIQVNLVETCNTAVQTYPQSPTLGPRLQSTNVSVTTSRKSSVDFNEMQEKVTAETLNRISKVEKVLEKKISGGMERIETQMKVFWDKLDEIEQNKNNVVKRETLEENSSSQETSTKNTNAEIKKDMKKEPPQIANRNEEKGIDKRHKKMKKHSPKIRTIFTQSLPSKKEAVKAAAIIENYSDDSSVFDFGEYEEEKNDEIKEENTPALKQYTQSNEQNTNINKNIKRAQTKQKRKELSARKLVGKIKKTSSEESDSSESEKIVSECKKLTAKPSNTSTLTKRSVTSLKNAMNDGKVVKELEKEVEQVLNNHLREMGVSPHWKGIPKRTFEQTMKVVRHQATLAKKNYPDYFVVRKQIIKNVDSKLQMKEKKPKTKSKIRKIFNFSGNIKTVNDVPVMDTKTEKMRKAVQKKTVNLPGEKVATTNYNERIKKPQSMYVTDSESEEIIQNPLAITNTNNFQTVIEELKNVQAEKVTDEHPNKNETKSALKNYPSTGSLTRKKVLFDLESESNTVPDNNVTVFSKSKETGSTTSIASSVFDGSKTMNSEQRSEEKNKNKDFEWDISDILD